MLHRLAKWCTKMWENRLYFARPTSIVLWMWRERNKWRSATYIHCPFSRSSWPMGFNLTRSYVTLLYVYLSCVRSTDSLSNHWLRIVNVRMRFEREKSEMKTEWLSERELWLVENQFLPACHIAYNLPFTIYHLLVRHNKATIAIRSDSYPINLYFNQSEYVSFLIAWQCD